MIGHAHAVVLDGEYAPIFAGVWIGPGGNTDSDLPFVIHTLFPMLPLLAGIYRILQ